MLYKFLVRLFDNNLGFSCLIWICDLFVKLYPDKSPVSMKLMIVIEWLYSG